MLLSWLGPLLQLAGGAVILWTARTVSRRARTAPALVLYGPYRFARHPACTGLLVMLVGRLLGGPEWPNMALLLAGVAGVAIWIAVTEARNVARFGEAYRRYQTTVPALFPLLLRHQRRAPFEKLRMSGIFF